MFFAFLVIYGMQVSCNAKDQEWHCQIEGKIPELCSPQGQGNLESTIVIKPRMDGGGEAQWEEYLPNIQRPRFDSQHDINQAYWLMSAFGRWKWEDEKFKVIPHLQSKF